MQTTFLKPISLLSRNDAPRSGRERQEVRHERMEGEEHGPDNVPEARMDTGTRMGMSMEKIPRKPRRR